MSFEAYFLVLIYIFNKNIIILLIILEASQSLIVGRIRHWSCVEWYWIVKEFCNPELTGNVCIDEPLNIADQ